MRPGTRSIFAAIAALIWLWSAPGGLAAASYDEGAAAFIRGDYEAAWREWRTLGERGHQSAQYNLGVLYAIGLGVDQDYAEAAKWFRRAADRGLPAAQMRLGTAYLEGQGVPQDPKEAYFWFTLAATHFSLGEQHDQAVAARERTGASLSPAELTEVLERAMGWQPVAQTMDGSEKERLIADTDESPAAAEPQGDLPSEPASDFDALAGAPKRAASLLGEQEAAPDAADAAPPGQDLAGLETAGATSHQAEAPAAPDANAAAGQAGAAVPAAAARPQQTARAAETGASAPAAGDNAVAAVGRAGFAAHLASVRSRGGTEAEWRSLRQRYPDLLGGKTLTVRTVEVADSGTFYRVMAGPFDDFDGAQELCSQLHARDPARDQYCVVRRLSEDPDG